MCGLRQPIPSQIQYLTSPGEIILELPDMIFQLNEIKILNEGREMIPKRRYPVVMCQKAIIKPQHQQILHTKFFFGKKLCRTYWNENTRRVFPKLYRIETFIICRHSWKRQHSLNFSNHFERSRYNYHKKQTSCSFNFSFWARTGETN